MTAKERDNLMKKVKPLENKLGNNKTCPGKNNKKQKKCTKWAVEVDRLRTALDNRVGGPCEQSKSENREVVREEEVREAEHMDEVHGGV